MNSLIRTKFLLVVFAVTGLVVAGAMFRPSAALAAGGTVTGRFLLNGSPVAANQIRGYLYVQTTSASGGYANSGSDGSFTISNVPAATNYYMQVTVVDTTLSAIGKYMYNISVSDGQTTNLGDIAVPYTPKTVSGTVKRADGTPVPNVRVTATKMVDFLSAYGVTNSSGQFSFKVGGGSWSVMPQQSKEPYVAGENVDFYWSGSIYQMFNFADDTSAETKTANFSVLSTNTILKGKIVNPSSTGQGSVNVKVGDFSTLTDASGNFTLHALSGKQQFTAQVFNDSRYYLPAQQVNLSDDETKDLGTITLSERKAHITGTVTTDTGTPLAGFSVNGYMENTTDDQRSNATTNASGAFDLLVSPGTWGLTAIKLSQPPYFDVSDDENPEVTISTETETKEVTFKKVLGDVIINVTAVDSTGAIVTSFLGSVGDINANVSGTLVNGQATICASSRKASVLKLKAYPQQGSQYTPGAIDPLTIAAGQTYTLKIPVAQNSVTVNGSLKDQNGNLLTTAQASITASNGSTSFFTHAAEGQFSFSLTPGSWTFFVYSSTTTYLSPSPLSRTLTAGVTALDVTMTKSEATVAGTLTGPNGELISNTQISLFRESTVGDPTPGYLYSYVNNGHFSIPVAGGRTYRLSVGLPSGISGLLPPDDKTIDVPATGTVTLNLKYGKEDGVITGSAFLPNGTKARTAYLTAFSESGQHFSTYTNRGSFRLGVTKNDRWHLKANTMVSEVYYESPEVIIDTPNDKDFVLSQNLALVPFTVNMPQTNTASFSTATSKVVNLSNGASIYIPANALSDTAKNVTMTVTPTTALPSTRNDKLIEGFGFLLRHLCGCRQGKVAEVLDVRRDG